MDNLFKIRTLTAAVNAMPAPAMVVYNRLFRQRAHLVPSSRMAVDIRAGSERILQSIAVDADAAVTTKTNRRVITLEAPRLAEKRTISAASMEDIRKLGDQVRVESLADRIREELQDMRNETDRTMEFWAANAIKGKIYDADLTKVLVDYNLPSSHDITLSGTGDELYWDNASSDPSAALRDLKLLIEDDCGTTITGWLAFLGSGVMNALLGHQKIRELLAQERGRAVAESGRVERLSEVDLVEYNGSFIDSSGTRRRFIERNEIVLIGLCPDLVDCPFAPVVNTKAPGGVGNVDENGRGVMFFAFSWDKDDGSARWIQVETRPLPVLQRPGAVVRATVIG
ncbi:MAG: major capsid protein [Pseudomonadota bacterium]